MTVFISRAAEVGAGPRLAVKDCIDVAGYVTTVGCRAVAFDAVAATEDATCLAGARAAGTQVVGKTTLHELCQGGTGVNREFGTPVNPIDRLRVPGGSSSGSAVAVAMGLADVAFGTDTGGSVRLPAACCGVAGLKTTHGLVPTQGVYPLAPSLDTVGVLAVDVARLHVGACWLLPGLTRATPAGQVLRVRPDVAVRPGIDAAVDRALALAGLPVADLPLTGWQDAQGTCLALIRAEAWRCQGHLLSRRGLLSEAAVRLLEAGRAVSDADLAAFLAAAGQWRARLEPLLLEGTVLALPTLADQPPLLADAARGRISELTAAVNVAGLPAISIPVPGPVITALQLVGGAGSEATLLATAAIVEEAVG
ncbi:MAG: amidase family protein [Pseudonocardiales bacterium]